MNESHPSEARAQRRVVPRTDHARLRVGPARIPKWLAGLAALALVSLALSAVALSRVHAVASVAASDADRSGEAIARVFGGMGAGVEQAVLTAIRTIDVPACLRTAAGQAGNLLSATVPDLTMVVQFVIGNLIDLILLGQALRLSSVGIILSLAFWDAVRGIAGMFLSVPIMVALMIVFARIQALRPVAVLTSRKGLPDDDA